MTELRYRAGLEPEQLVDDECTIRKHATNGSWILWIRVRKATDGHPILFAVGVNPNANESDGRWGLSCSGVGRWQVRPSIREVDKSGREIWHKTPVLVGVPTSETWTTSSPR